jgi:hypothetical protein
LKNTIQWPQEKGQTINGLQNTTQKTKDWTTQTKNSDELKYSGRVSSS